MKKFGISSPADLKTDEKKKEFFNYIDKNFKAQTKKMKRWVKKRCQNKDEN